MNSVIQPIEYEITLSTREHISVSELDRDRIPELKDSDVITASSSVIELCPVMPREALEAAKMGHSKHFEEMMIIPPIGAMMKMSRPLCQERDFCSSYRSCCSIRNVSRKGIPGRFPVCWEFEPQDGINNETCFFAKRIVATVVFAWREGRTVVII